MIREHAPVFRYSTLPVLLPSSLEQGLLYEADSSPASRETLRSLRNTKDH
jgi:hypothetical protein